MCGGGAKAPSQPAYVAPAPVQQDPEIDPVTGQKRKKAQRGGSSTKTILTSAQGLGGNTDTSKKNVLGA